MDEDDNEIVAVLVRYARAVDTRDWALFRTCFTDDVTADYGEIGSWQGTGDLVAFMDRAHAGMGPTQHRLSNFLVEVHGDRATSVTYVHVVAVLASGPDDWIDTIGTYEDALVRTSDGWRISRRTYRTTRLIVSPSLSPSTSRHARGERNQS
jgi:hypothetical protein